MRRKIFIVLSVAVFFLGITKLSFAMMCGDHSGRQQMAQAHTEHEPGITEAGKAAVSKEAVNAGNKICPVSGEKIDEKIKVIYEYSGKVYNLCCASCIEEFKKDPQKYIKKVEQELQAKPLGQTGEEKEALPESEMPSGMHEGHHH
ncbi:MAG: YHS domain-containing protein [Candidatus Omnitrophota bacterium]|nr:YHS domain-containing protein [Candidatus Omnitrophota bacterium]